MVNEDLRQELLQLRGDDERVRSKLVEDGSLFSGYAPEMERLHLRNADRLEAIILQHGWPGIVLVGHDGAAAAWLIAQHAISRPAFQRRCLELLQAAVRAGDAAPTHEAHLTDRIRFNERKPQRFGTILDWDESGQLSPWTIEDPDGVDQRRAAVGLPPLGEEVRRRRLEGEAGEGPPADFEARQRQMRAWARGVGWL